MRETFKDKLVEYERWKLSPHQFQRSKCCSSFMLMVLFPGNTYCGSAGDGWDERQIMGRLINTISKELKEHVGWINSIFNNVLVCCSKMFPCNKWNILVWCSIISICFQAIKKILSHKILINIFPVPCDGLSLFHFTMLFSVHKHFQGFFALSSESSPEVLLVVFFLCVLWWTCWGRWRMRAMGTATRDVALEALMALVSADLTVTQESIYNLHLIHEVWGWDCSLTEVCCLDPGIGWASNSC